MDLIVFTLGPMFVCAALYAAGDYTMARSARARSARSAQLAESLTIDVGSLLEMQHVDQARTLVAGDLTVFGRLLNAVLACPPADWPDRAAAQRDLWKRATHLPWWRTQSLFMVFVVVALFAGAVCAGTICLSYGLAQEHGLVPNLMMLWAGAAPLLSIPLLWPKLRRVASDGPRLLALYLTLLDRIVAPARARHGTGIDAPRPAAGTSSVA